MNPVYIVDIVGECVQAVITEVLTTIISNEAAAIGQSSPMQTIDYQYGHKIELIETLQQMDKDPTGKFQKYPLVYLVQDFKETRGKTSGIYAETNLNIIIAHHTTSSFKITDRYNQVFKPVLYPIYYSLLNQLAKHPQLNEEDETMVTHGKTDRSYWGRTAIGGNDKLKITDTVDAIEIDNLALKILYQTCPP